MRTPSTADGAGADRESATAKTNQGQTHANVKGETAPRLPHERDESADTEQGAQSELLRRAQKDVEAGMQPTDRSDATDEVYRRNLRDRPPGNERDAPSDATPPGSRGGR
jgi:hypothetical protein